jgi:hypothetical protein
MVGTVRVRRTVSSFSTGFSTAHRSRASSAGCGEEARGVAVLAYSEQDEIQARRAAEEFL